MDTLLLLCWAIVVLVPLLGASPVFQVSEAREGSVVEEILRSGEFVLPLRNGDTIPSKPPLFHWLGSAVAKVLGGSVDEIRLRAPSALAALGMLVALSRALSAIPGSRAYIVGFLMLLSSYGFVRLAQDGRVDMVFSALVVGAICEWIRCAIQAKGEGRLLGEVEGNCFIRVAFLCGLAVLAKGPLGIVLPLLTILAVAAWEEGRRGVLAIARPAWLLAFLVPLPWYVAAALAGDEAFVGRQILFENLSRFVGGEGITPKPFWFYIPHFFSQGAPWSVVIAIYAFFLLRGTIDSHRGRSAGNLFLPSDEPRRFGIRAGLIWIASTVIFLSLSSGKRRGYLLPILPAIALVLAIRFEATWKRLQDERKATRILSTLNYELFTWGILVWLIAAVAIGGVYFLPFELVSILPDNSELELFVRASFDYAARTEGMALLLPTGMLLIVLALWLLCFLRKEPRYGLLAGVGFVQTLVMLAATVLVGVKGMTHTYRDFADTVRAKVPLEIPIQVIKTRRDESLDGFFFYMRRHMRIVDPETAIAPPGIFLARRDWYSSRRESLSGTITVLAEGGRRVDEQDRELVLFALNDAKSW